MDAFLDACEQAGHGRNDDFNAASQDGFGHYQLTQRDGRRCRVWHAPGSSGPNGSEDFHRWRQVVQVGGTLHPYASSGNLPGGNRQEWLRNGRAKCASPPKLHFVRHCETDSNEWRSGVAAGQGHVVKESETMSHYFLM